MTHLKQLGGKLLSLLLAFAMILALMPAVSLTASAEEPKYVLKADTPQFSSDGWTWDGQTLHFFGSGTYEVNSDYFSIESTNGGAAVIDISGALTVNFTAYTSTFINSSCALDIKGAGKITVSAAYGYNRLFKSGGDITYAGGAICTDSELYLFANINSFTMSQGHIDAPNAYIEARSHTIKNSYVAINSFNTSVNYSDVINIDRSFVDTQTLLTTDKFRGLSITLNNSVLRSAADSSEFELDDNDIKKPKFSKVTNSVVYLTKVADVVGLTLSTALTSQYVQKAVDGGYVFCNQLITDADLSGGNLNGKVNTKFAQLSGAFYWSATNDILRLDNLTLSGGVLFSAPFSLQLYDNAKANNAAIVILADKAEPIISIQKANNCTVVAINESASSNDITFQIYENVDKCNVYSTTDGIIYAGTPVLPTNNSYYVPNGTVNVFTYFDPSNYDRDSYSDFYGSITAKKITAGSNPLKFSSNICADVLEMDRDMAFNGSDAYSVSFGGVTGNGTIYFYNCDVVDFACEKVNGSWGLFDDEFGYDGGADRQLYIGRQVFNTLAADEAKKTYDALTLSKGSSATINVPLTLPFEQWIFRHEIYLYDEQNKPYVLGDVGLTADFVDVDGGSNSLNVVLKAGSNVTAGDYELCYIMNGKPINKGRYIPLTLSDSYSHTMEFGNDSSISWPYTDKKGNSQTFTGEDYEKNIEADTWTWYGKGDRENGYSKSTLVLNNGFNFTTTADYGISKTKQTTFNIVVNGSCTVNAAVGAIHSGQNVTLNINGADDNSTLSVNTGIVSDESLYISGVDIEANNVDSIIKASAQIKPLLQSAEETFLYDCKITANDRWEGKEVIKAPELKITRSVTLDLPASTINAGTTYIGELESVDNILNGLIGSAALTVEDSPYGEYSGVSSLKWKDAGFGMKLSTKPLEFTGTASDLIISDDTISEDGDYCLFSGKEYRLDLSKLIGVDISDCEITKNVVSGYSVKSELVDGTQYLIVTPGKNATGSTAKSTIGVVDSNRFYGSKMPLKLDVTLGRVVKADRIGFYCQGNYDINKQCYIPSATYKGNPLELKKDGYNYYYLVPSDEEIEITLIPADGYRFDSVSLGEWKYDGGVLKKYGLSPSGTYTVTTKGADVQLLMDINETTVQQYYNVDLADSLRQDVADGKIKSVTLTYSDGSVKVVDGTTVDDFPTYATKDKPVTVSIAVPTDSSGDPLIAVKSVNGVNANYNSDEQKYISGYFRIDKDTVITAEYEIPATSATVTVNCGEHGTVTPATAEYPIGTSVTLTVTPDEGYRVKSAQLDGNAVTLTNGAYTFTVTTDCVFAAEFEEIPAGSATVTVNCGEHGTVTPATADYAIGTSVTLTVTPDEGYRVKSAQLDGNAVTLTNGAYTFTVTADCVFAAEFEEIPAGSATVTVNCGEHGTVTPATADYAIGTSVTLTVTPDEGYRVKSAQLDGNAVTLTNGAYTFTVTADCVFAAEFEEIPAGSATVTVNCGEHGTVTPATADYAIGTSVTLTVTPDEGYRVKSAQLDGNAVTLTNGAYTFTVTADCVFSVEFQKKPTGGNSGGGSGRPSGRVNGDSTADDKLTINGKATDWSDLPKTITDLAKGSEVKIDLNGSYDVPADVIKAIADGKIKVTFVIDGFRSWLIDGADITAPAAENLRVITLGTLDTAGLRGTAGYKFSLSGTNNPATLTVSFNKEYAGKFANLYKVVDGKPVFTGVVKVGADGSAALHDMGGKGDYVIMLGEYSDLKGDADNNGVVDINDARITLRHYIKYEQVTNAEMADFDDNRDISIVDARAILRHAFGLSD